MKGFPCAVVGGNRLVIKIWRSYFCPLSRECSRRGEAPVDTDRSEVALVLCSRRRSE